MTLLLIQLCVMYEITVMRDVLWWLDSANQLCLLSDTLWYPPLRPITDYSPARCLSGPRARPLTLFNLYFISDNLSLTDSWCVNIDSLQATDDWIKLVPCWSDLAVWLWWRSPWSPSDRIPETLQPGLRSRAPATKQLSGDTHICICYLELFWILVNEILSFVIHGTWYFIPSIKNF